MERDSIRIGAYVGLGAVVVAIAVALVIDAGLSTYLNLAWADPGADAAVERDAADPADDVPDDGARREP